jgi:carbamoylphosphate synthase small subunit
LYLNRHKIPVIWDIDTRALVRHIRNVGALRGLVRPRKRCFGNPSGCFPG